MAVCGGCSAALGEIEVCRRFVDRDGVVDEPRPARMEPIGVGEREHVRSIVVWRIRRSVGSQEEAIAMLAGIARSAKRVAPTEGNGLLFAYILGDGEPSTIALSLILELKVGWYIAMHAFKYGANGSPTSETELSADFRRILVRNVLRVQLLRERSREIYRRYEGESVKVGSKGRDSIFGKEIAGPVHPHMPLIAGGDENADIVDFGLVGCRNAISIAERTI